MCAVFIVECTQARRRPLRLVNVKSLHLVPLHLLLHSIYGDLVMYRPMVPFHPMIRLTLGRTNIHVCHIN